MFLFIFLVSLWAVSILVRLLVLNVDFSGHKHLVFVALDSFHGASDGLWGLRFFGAHLFLELVLICILVGFAISGNTAKTDRFLKWGALALFLSPFVHGFLMNWDTGYKLRAEVAGQNYSVPWKYEPQLIQNSNDGPALRVKLNWPSYGPYYKADDPARQMTLTVTRASFVMPYILAEFGMTIVRPGLAKCSNGEINRYCVFSAKQGWYSVHFRVPFGQAEFNPPTLEELQARVPAVFNRFATDGN